MAKQHYQSRTKIQVIVVLLDGKETDETACEAHMPSSMVHDGGLLNYVNLRY